jgi:hypothetical protein
MCTRTVRSMKRELGRKRGATMLRRSCSSLARERLDCAYVCVCVCVCVCACVRVHVCACVVFVQVHLCVLASRHLTRWYKYVGLTKTIYRYIYIYIYRHIGWFPCQKYCAYTIYNRVDQNSIYMHWHIGRFPCQKHRAYTVYKRVDQNSCKTVALMKSLQTIPYIHRL